MTYVCRLAVTGLLAAVCNLSGQGGQTLQIVTDSLPVASVGSAYLQQLTVAGGTCQGAGAATATIDAGTFPPGLAIVSPSGVEQWFIQGLPAAGGVFQFTVHLRWTHAKTTPFDQA
jgi:hypothetical protein